MRIRKESFPPLTDRMKDDFRLLRSKPQPLLERNFKIYDLLVGKPELSLREVGEIYNLSRERVAQIGREFRRFSSHHR